MKNAEIVSTRKIFVNIKQCPSCGAKSFLGIIGKKCFWCGDVFCGNCKPKWQSTLAFKFVNEGKQRKDAIYRSVGFCSGKCSDEFWGKVLSLPAEDFMETDNTNFSANWVRYWNASILSALEEAKDESANQVKQAAKIHTEKYPAFPYYDLSHLLLPQAQKSQYNAEIALAQNLVACGRPLDAANIYEALKLYDKARLLRETDKRIIIKRTDLYVNLNSLLQQFRDSGMVAVYRCPHCGGKLKLGKDSSVESLRICEHCGSEVETMDLVDLLEKALE